MTLIARKHDFIACKQQRHAYSLIGAFVFCSLQSFISKIESYLVRNSIDRISFATRPLLDWYIEVDIGINYSLHVLGTTSSDVMKTKLK